jgi:hypothetical protein
MPIIGLSHGPSLLDSSMLASSSDWVESADQTRSNKITHTPDYSDASDPAFWFFPYHQDVLFHPRLATIEYPTLRLTAKICSGPEA